MRRFLILLLFALPSWGAIARDGNGGAVGTSFTFSATATGDLKIVVAFDSGATTIPTLPSGWTTIATVATTTGGTPGAIRIGCNVSSSSGDTGSGTWTNATDVVGVSYSGTLVNVTADCNLTGVGNRATNSAKASTTVNFPTIAVQAANNWVLGIAADSGVIVGAPSLMSQFKTAGTGPSLAANDTNATVSSWASTNVTVTSSTWLSFVGEILGPVPACTGTCPTLVSTKFASSAGESGNAFKFTYGGALGTGSLLNNLLVFVIAYPHGSTLSPSVPTDNAGNTWILVDTGDSGTGGWVLQQYYIVGKSAGVNLITTTFSATVSDFHAALLEYRNIATSSPLDGTCTNNGVAGPKAVCSAAITTTTPQDMILITALDAPSNTILSPSFTITSVVAGFPTTLVSGSNGSGSTVGSFSSAWVQPSAGTITPFIVANQSTSDNFDVVAGAWKSASAGTSAGTGIQLIHEEIAYLPTASYTTIFPSSGNLLWIGVDDINNNTGGNIVTIATSPANTFTKYCGGSCAGNTIFPQSFYICCSAATSPTLTMSFTSGHVTDSTLVHMYDVANAVSHDTDSNGSGTQCNAGENIPLATCGTDNFAGAPSITPGGQPGMAFTVLQNGTGPSSNLAGTATAGLIYDNTNYTSETDQSKMNNGDTWSHGWFTSTGQINWVWTMANVSATNWSAVADTFLGPAPASTSAVSKIKKLIKLGEYQ
jgi:hypothetical protein